MSIATEAGRARQSARNGWLLSLPAVIVLLIGSAGPLLIVVYYSFMTKGEHFGVQPPFTLEAWFKVVFARDIFDGTISFADANLLILWRSVKLAFLTTVITFALGLPTAWFIATRPPKARMIWLFLITIPFWTNLLIRTFAILEVIRNEGLINSALIGMGVIATPIQLLYTDGATLAGMAYVYLPFMVLPLYAAIDRFDLRLIEAAYDLYASRWAVLARVILPIIQPGIIGGCILVFVPALGAYVTPRVLGGNKNMMIGNFIELLFGPGKNWPLASALSIVLLVIVMIAVLVYVRVSTKGGVSHG